MGEPVASQKAPYKTDSSPKSPAYLPTPAFLRTKGGFFDESVPTYPCLYGGHAVGRYLPRTIVGPWRALQDRGRADRHFQLWWSGGWSVYHGSRRKIAC